MRPAREARTAAVVETVDMTESGFPSGARTTPVPDLFFSRYVPDRLSPAAMKVFLHLLWRIHRRKAGHPPAMRMEDLAADATLRRGLAAEGGEDGAAAQGSTDAEGTARRNVDNAVGKALDELLRTGLILAADVAKDDGAERWLFVNNHEGRSAYGRWEEGGLVLPELPSPAVPAAEADDRPSIFTLYEENIGVLTPLLAEELGYAQDAYPEEWITEAFTIAVTHNARSWAYVKAILERWLREGREDETTKRRRREDRERDVEGPYASYIEH